MSWNIPAADQPNGHQSTITNALFLQRSKSLIKKLQVGPFSIFAGPVFNGRISGRSLRMAHDEFLSRCDSEHTRQTWHGHPWLKFQYLPLPEQQLLVPQAR